jgi:hypothetical protein
MYPQKIAIVFKIFFAIFTASSGITVPKALADQGHGSEFSLEDVFAPKDLVSLDLSRLDPLSQARLVQRLAVYGIDVAGVNVRTRSVDVLVNTKQRRWIQSAFPMIRLETRMTLDQSLTGLDPRFPNPTRIEARMRALVERFPNSARLLEIGKTHEGRTIYAIHFSSRLPVNDYEELSKPSILVDGMHHAREVMTPEVAIDVAESLLNGSLLNEKWAKALLEQFQFYVIPMLNPDGNNIVWDKNRMWRKNARADGGRVYGVDINRNYPALWNTCNGSSGFTGSDTYRGPSAGSEPEVASVIRLADRIRPAGYLSYHSYSEIVIYPYGCQGKVTREHKTIKQIGDEMASRIIALNGRDSYVGGTGWELLYPVDGASIDFYYLAYGAPAYVVEVDKEFQPSYDQRDITVARNREGWIYFFQTLAQNMLSLEVISGKTGRPVPAALVTIDSIQREAFERTFSTNSSGFFHKMLPPGTHLVTVRDSSGKESQVEVQMSGQAQRVRVVLE